MEKIGFSLQERYCLPMPEVVDLLANAGFQAVSVSWQRDTDLTATVSRARQRGLAVQSLHGPLRGMPALWSSDPAVFQPILADVLDSARTCAALHIPVLVIHPWNGVDYSFHAEDLYFDHFDALVALAEELGIVVAFENLEGPEYLTALMERYVNYKTVGFCWDTGHALCYAPGWDFLSRFGDRLVMTHLNDNQGVTDTAGKLQGTDDLHLLPFDGIVNWEDTVTQLKAAKQQEILNFELKIRPKGDRCRLDLYSQMPLMQYFRKAYQRACRAVDGYFDNEKEC